MFESISKKISETGKAVGDKTKQVAEVAKLSYKVNEELRKAEELYAELGKAVYETEKDNTESVFYAKISEITDKLAKADTLKAELNALRGVVICEKCGAEVPLENDFCGKCGAKVEKPEPAPVEEEKFDYDFSEDKAEDVVDVDAAADEVSDDSGV